MLKQVLLKGSMAHGGHMLEQVYSERLLPVEKTSAGADLS